MKVKHEKIAGVIIFEWMCELFLARGIFLDVT